ncbi:MAG: rhomboid family intramembrane serine protease [Bacteroidota bacterium]
MQRASIVPPLRFLFLMWLFFSIEFVFHIDLSFLGIQPRTVSGALGILTAPLIHGSVQHIISNTFPMLFLGVTLYVFYSRIANQVFLQCYLFTNFFVWLLARDSYHIGASGVVYALAAFLIAMGLFKRDFRSLLISLVVILIYGGLVYGLFSTDQRISWESHLFGAIVGVGTAWGLSKSRKIPR